MFQQSVQLSGSIMDVNSGTGGEVKKLSKVFDFLDTRDQQIISIAIQEVTSGAIYPRKTIGC